MTATPDLDALKDLARRATEAEVAVADLRQQRDALALALYEAGGCTYEDLAKALGVTRDRINQVLRGQRRTRERVPV